MSSSHDRMKDENAAGWLQRANLGLHTGWIGGYFLKTVFFLASLICASLPITGFYIWWGKKKKKPIRRPQKKIAITSLANQV